MPHFYKNQFKKNKILPFSATGMDLEGIMLSEISQDTGRQILYDITYMWNLKIKTTEYSEKVDTYIENKLVDISQKRKGRRARQGYWLRKCQLLCTGYAKYTDTL